MSPWMRKKNITDDIRIQRALPTIQHILEQEGKLILCSHMGRPKGQRNEAYSLAPVAAHLATILERDVKTCSRLYRGRIRSAGCCHVAR